MAVKTKKKRFQGENTQLSVFLWGEYRRKKMQKVAYAAIIIYDKINRGEEIPAAASAIQDASPNKKLV